MSDKEKKLHGRLADEDEIKPDPAPIKESFWWPEPLMEREDFIYFGRIFFAIAVIGLAIVLAKTYPPLAVPVVAIGLALFIIDMFKRALGFK